MNSISLQNPKPQSWRIISLAVLFLMLTLQVSAQIECTGLSRLFPPDFDVSETHWEDGKSFWQNGGHIPANVVDEDTSNYARAHIKKTGSATIRVTDSSVVYEAGLFAGFYIKSPAFPGGNRDAVTISTYLNGVLQESYSGSGLLTEVAEGNNDPILIGFVTTLPFNEIEVTFDTRQGMVHFDVFYAVHGLCLSGLLPVSWLSFEASKHGETIALTWTTAQEINNAGFYVERSDDGQQFVTIGYVDADDQSRDVRAYSFSDPKPFSGLNYYRIRQIDHDGAIGYSPVRTLSFKGKGVSIRLWPNPAAESLFIEIPGQEDAGGEIRLINSTGAKVWSQSYDQFDTQTQIDTRSLQPGIYHVIIESTGNIYTEKIIILN